MTCIDRKYPRLDGLRRFCCLAVPLILLLISGCVLLEGGEFNKLSFSGYVREQAGSSPVPGAEVSISCYSMLDLYKFSVMTDASGFYDLACTIPVESPLGNLDEREWLLTVTDVDSTLNGEFLSVDTLLIEYDPQHNLETDFVVDIYVVLIENCHQ